MATTLIRNAQAIVTVDREDRVLRNGNILVEDNIIRYIGPAERAADRVIDASHCFVYPGLVNTHHHLYQTFTRNLPQVQKMELLPELLLSELLLSEEELLSLELLSLELLFC